MFHQSPHHFTLECSVKVKFVVARLYTLPDALTFEKCSIQPNQFGVHSEDGNFMWQFKKKL